MTKRELLRRIWKDNVWGNVIAGIILAVSFALFSSIITLLRGLFDKIPFESIVENIKEIFLTTTTLPNWLILISLVFILTSVSLIFRQIFKEFWKRIHLDKRESRDEEDEFEFPFNDSLPIFHYGTSMNFFQARLGKAFPAMRDEVKWYFGKHAIDRLEIFLQKPLLFKGTEEGSYRDPIWWFRAGSSMYIKRFKRLSKTKCLMNIDELVINKIAVYRDDYDYRHFIYVEVSADKSTGVYQHLTDKMKDYIDHFSYMWEEYGLLNGKPIKREEYDDGSAEIKGKVVDAADAKLRVRYLTPYNFVITPQDSPYNSHKFDRESKDYLNGLLNNSVDFSDFLEFMKGFQRHEE
jgi:hypothetical protein